MNIPTTVYHTPSSCVKRKNRINKCSCLHEMQHSYRGKNCKMGSTCACVTLVAPRHPYAINLSLTTTNHINSYWVLSLTRKHCVRYTCQKSHPHAHTATTSVGEGRVDRLERLERLATGYLACTVSCVLFGALKKRNEGEHAQRKRCAVEKNTKRA
jgi:hypothetical protein